MQNEWLVYKTYIISDVYYLYDHKKFILKYKNKHTSEFDKKIHVYLIFINL